MLELLPALVLCLIIFYFSVRKNFKVNLQEKKWILFFLFLGLSGVLPIMVSMKQSSFYILTAFPFFSIAFGILVAPFTGSLIQKIRKQASILSVIIIIVSVFLSVKQIGVIGRNQDMINDIQLILTVIPKDSAISMEKDMSKNYSLIGYFTRYGNVSLDSKNKKQYHLSYKEMNEDLENRYTQVDIGTNMLFLYKY